MVVGAGRGPIVRAVLRAANSSNVNVIVYALDKNPHAVNAYDQLNIDHMLSGDNFHCIVYTRTVQVHYTLSNFYR